jgi:hypothetical protein
MLNQNTNPSWTRLLLLVLAGVALYKIIRWISG